MSLDYIPYTLLEYAVDAPASALHFQRWFQNWEAGFGGAAGAPRLSVGSLQRLTAGDQIRSRVDEETTIGNGMVGATSLAFMQAGTIRVTFENSGSSSCVINRQRNGVVTVLATFSGPGISTWVAGRTADIPVLPGDVVCVSRSGATGNSAVRNLRFSTNGEDLFPAAGGVKLEGNTYNA